MFTVTKYPHGTFSWADCSSSDAGVRYFYARLMGWDIDEAPMGGGLVYYTFRKDGYNVAAVSELPPQMADMPPSWNNYITVDDVDALAPRVQKLGGKLLQEPFDIFEHGRLLMCQDPQGAAISFWQPYNHIGAGLVNTPGALCWNELFTREPQAAQAFYGALLGREFENLLYNPVKPAYVWIRNNGRSNGGMYYMDEDLAGQMVPGWIPYFSVADIDATHVRVVELGGTVLAGPEEHSDGGRALLISDAQGARCYLIQVFRPEPWIE